jgi:hypothetical protein
MSLAERKVSIQTQPNPDRRGTGLGGIPVELTRVQGDGKGFDVSTVQHPLTGWFETVLFPLEPNADLIGPLLTESRPQAKQIHQFTVEVAAHSLETR